MDKNPESYQWLILFILYGIVLILLSQLNQSLATVSLFLFMNGLLVSFPALFLPLGQGITAVFLFSIFYDSGESWNIGVSLVPNLVTFTVLYYLRDRIQYDNRSAYKMVVLVVNLILYLYYTILAGSTYGVTSQFVFLNLLHLLVSEFVLFLVAGLLISYQKDVLRMFNIDVDASLRAAK